MRRMIITASVVAALAAASIGVAWATTSADHHAASPAGTRTPAMQPAAHVVRFYAHGPSALYGSDFGDIGTVDPLRFRLPATADTYRVRITLSFEYRTKGTGRFYVVAAVKRGITLTRLVFPRIRHVAASGDLASVTMVFTARLQGNVNYALDPGANIHRTDLHRAVINTRRLLVDIEAWPAGG